MDLPINTSHPSSKGLSAAQKEGLLPNTLLPLDQGGNPIAARGPGTEPAQEQGTGGKRFYELLKKALEVPKKRNPTKPTKSSVERRLQSKKKASTKKEGRKPPDLG